LDPRVFDPPLGARCTSDLDFAVVRCLRGGFFEADASLVELLLLLDDPELEVPELLLLLLLELLSDDPLLVDSVRGFLLPLPSAAFPPLLFSADIESLVLCWDLLADDFSLGSAAGFRLSLVPTSPGDMPTLSVFVCRADPELGSTSVFPREADSFVAPSSTPGSSLLSPGFEPPSFLLAVFSADSAVDNFLDFNPFPSSLLL